MRLRHATQRDASAMAHIHAECCKTDVLARYLYKDIEKYPTSYALGVLRFIRRQFLLPGSWSLVVETEPSDYPAGQESQAPEVIGYARYHRLGQSEAAQKWNQTNNGIWDKVNRFLMRVEDRYFNLVPSEQPTRNAPNVLRILPVLGTPWDSEIFVEALEVALLYTRPDWQRRGVGKMLLNWGFEQAQKEKIPVVVKASSLGAAAYRAVGFKSIVEYSFAQFFDELEFGGEASQGWVWEPTLDEDDIIEGKWYERAIAKRNANTSTVQNIDETVV